MTAQVTIAGNLTRDPELTFTAGGVARCTFSVAVVRFWTSGGEKQEATSFFEVTAWSHVAEHVAESFRKADTVIVAGRLEQDSWESKDGKKQSQVKIVADQVGASARWGPVHPYRRSDLPGKKVKSVVPFGEEPF